MRKIIRALAFGFCLSLCLSGCSTPLDFDDTEQISDYEAEEVNSDTTPEIIETTAGTISTGYIDAGAQPYISLFQQADSGSAVIARLYTGDMIDVCSLETEWSLISVEGLRGYVLTQNIVFRKPEQTTAATVAEATSTAASSAEQPAGTTAAQTQSPTNITIVLQYDSQGIALPSCYPTYVSYTDVRNGYCSAHSCYMYKTASKSGPKREAEMLYEGDPVTIHGEYDGMYYLGTESGSGYDWLGYVPKEYITIGTPPVSARQNYSAVAGVVDATSCHVRSTPSKENDDNIIETVEKGFSFDIISFDGYWYYISYGGKTGYISYKMVNVW